MLCELVGLQADFLESQDQVIDFSVLGANCKETIGLLGVLMLRKLILYLEKTISGVLCLLGLRLNPSSQPVTRNRFFWVLLLLCFALGVGLYWEFHGIVFYTSHIPN